MSLANSDTKQGLAASLGERLAVFRELGIVVLLIMIIGGVSSTYPEFLSTRNMREILLWVPLLVVVAMGEMMVIITRGIDVSVGSILGFTGIVVGMVFREYPQFNIYAATLTGIFIGACLGAVNGSIIAWTRVPPIIATLGALSAFRGLTFIVSDGHQVDPNHIPAQLTNWSRDGLFGYWPIPKVCAVPILVATATFLFLRYTRTGRNIYAIGGNPEAARLRGIPVQRTVFLVYALAGAAAGLAGILYASHYGLINPGSAGRGFELTVIAAVVIGGTNIFGGAGTVPGVLLGCLLLGTTNVALSVLKIAGNWQLAVYGFVILFVVVMDNVIKHNLRKAQDGR